MLCLSPLKNILNNLQKLIFPLYPSFQGYMCSPTVLDKDGVSAAVIAAEMSSFLATKNIYLSQQLENIYNE